MTINLDHQFDITRNYSHAERDSTLTALERIIRTDKAESFLPNPMAAQTLWLHFSKQNRVAIVAAGMHALLSTHLGALFLLLSALTNFFHFAAVFKVLVVLLHILHTQLPAKVSTHRENPLHYSSSSSLSSCFDKPSFSKWKIYILVENSDKGENSPTRL